MSLQQLITVLIGMAMLYTTAHGSFGTLQGHITQDTTLFTDTVSVTGGVWMDSQVVVEVPVGTIVLLEGHSTMSREPLSSGASSATTPAGRTVGLFTQTTGTPCA